MAQAQAVDAAEDEAYGEARGDELPPELASAQGRRKWLREAQRVLDRRRAEEARPVPRSRPQRLKEAKRRLEEELDVECRANAAYEAYRAMKNGRRFGAPPKPYQPPATPEGRINLTDPDSRVVKGLRGFIPGLQRPPRLSVRHARDVPPRRRSTPSIASIRCAKLMPSLITARQRPENDRPDEHIGRLAPRRLRELQPVPLDLLARLMSKLDRDAVPAGPARLAARAQPEQPQLPHERHVGALEPELDDLAIEHRPVDVRVIDQSRCQVVAERLKAARRPAPATARPRSGTCGPSCGPDRCAARSQTPTSPSAPRHGSPHRPPQSASPPGPPSRLQASRTSDPGGGPRQTARGNSLRSGPTGLRSASYRDTAIRGGEFSRSDLRRISRSPPYGDVPAGSVSRLLVGARDGDEPAGQGVSSVGADLRARPSRHHELDA